MESNLEKTESLISLNTDRKRDHAPEYYQIMRVGADKAANSLEENYSGV